MAVTSTFSLAKIRVASFDMNVNSSQGPDSFGPAFYRLFWPTVRNDVYNLFSSFYDGTVYLDGLNRAHLVLLPKKEGAHTADAFRPISL